MQLLEKISERASELFGRQRGEKSQLIPTDPLDVVAWPFTDGLASRLSLQRPNPPLRYDTASAFQAYQSHELIYSCIQKIADVMNDAELIVERQSADGWAKVEGHALPALFKRPNPIETGRDFRRLMVQSEQSTGIFYAQISRSAAGLPVELHPLNPLRIQLWPNTQTGQIAFYRYRRPDGKFYDILPEDMLIRRRSDMVNRFFGLAPLSVALKSINSDIGLTDYVDAFFASDGTPAGILKILNVSLSQTRKSSRSLQNGERDMAANGNNQKGVAVLDQDASFESIGSKLKELAIDQVSDRFESRICSVFGVPPILVGSWVGLKHTTARATAAAALRDFWDNKVNGELSSLRNGLRGSYCPNLRGLMPLKLKKYALAGTFLM
jgi:HK97 family phage portal protein